MTEKTVTITLTPKEQLQVMVALLQMRLEGKWSAKNPSQEQQLVTECEELYRKFFEADSSPMPLFLSEDQRFAVCEALQEEMWTLDRYSVDDPAEDDGAAQERRGRIDLLQQALFILSQRLDLRPPLGRDPAVEDTLHQLEALGRAVRIWHSGGSHYARIEPVPDMTFYTAVYSTFQGARLSHALSYALTWARAEAQKKEFGDSRE